ncbi:hypothetical protein C5C66_08215 [Rathayibacter toxicus]|nr:hypothetical protein C5D17_08220 [Rathayibacter toxicus]PPH59581.1 hypothetical protein C5C93_08245 [Rathayibacter toxicus]PPH63034.1 hypothetical protein C5D13_08270 [Rathayibacter toxicus]PPH81005.1 hypothetical protein C5D20_08240 [Rathayibacter toxicus]PPH86811.1 hypothetical protein C5D31_08250 [Rathayibacter toxicus]
MGGLPVMIAFDEHAALLFSATARSVEDDLRWQSVSRQDAVACAMPDFTGSYRQLFEAAVDTETGDRTALRTLLSKLARQVDQAREAAQKERQRLRALEIWQSHQEERPLLLNDSSTSDPFRAFRLSEQPRPSDPPVLPPAIEANFSPRGRRRTVEGEQAQTSSADPVHLREYVARYRSSDSELEGLLDKLTVAWARFVSNCSWVPLGSVTVFGGMKQLIAENRADGDWIERVAAAFEAAGGGSLSPMMLDLAAASSETSIDDARLLKGMADVDQRELGALWSSHPELERQLRRLDPAAVNSWWHRLDGDQDSLSPRQSALLDTFPTLFGTLEGIPYRARDRANRAALEAALAANAVAHDKLAAELDEVIHRPGSTQLEIAAATQRILKLTADAQALQNIRTSLQPPGEAPSRFLISLTQDSPPLAAIALGDLDTAPSVAFAVPGMGQTTRDMGTWTKAAQNLQTLIAHGGAVVAWVGYPTPPVPLSGGVGADFSVQFNRHAEVGGATLARSLRGFAAVRQKAPLKPDILAYSYGTTVAAFATMAEGVEVGTLVTLGSAGLPNQADEARDLHVDAVYAGEARRRAFFDPEGGDEAAWMGRELSTEHRVNPMDPHFGGHSFGVETGGDAGRVVTDHSAIVSDNGPRAGYLDQGTESLKNAARALSGQNDKVTPNKPLGPTRLQQEIEKAAPYGF